MENDVGELALRISKQTAEKVKSLELSFEVMRAQVEGSIPPPKKRRTKTTWAMLGSLVPIIVAIITWIANVQIERIKAESKVQLQEMVRQKIESSDRKLEDFIQRSADASAKRAVIERDDSIDRLTAH